MPAIILPLPVTTAVTRYLRWGPHASLQDTEAYLAEVLEDSGQALDGLWGIELPQEGRLVGTIHLMDIDERHLKADVGVVVNAQYWRKDIGSEALQRVLAFCFDDLSLQRVQGLPITENAAACRMLEKCGMRARARCAGMLCKRADGGILMYTLS